MTKHRNPIRKYLWQVWVMLPCSSKEKRVIISMLEETLQAYVIANPFASYEEIKSHFGEPEEVVCSYFHHLDSVTLTRKWRTKKRVSFFLLIVAMVLTILLCVVPQKANQSVINESEIKPTKSNQIAAVDKLEQQLDAYQDALAQINSSK